VLIEGLLRYLDGLLEWDNKMGWLLRYSAGLISLATGLGFILIA
jgi:hypothetical protein